MTLDFFSRTSGTWINIASVLLGTTTGLLLQQRLPGPMQRIITQSVGLITLFVGFSMAGSLTKLKAGNIDGVVLGLLSLAIGGLLGEWWRLEEKLQSLGDWLKGRFSGGGSFTEGFVTASLLFCVGPMTIIGCINNGLTGNHTLLFLKSIMDGLTAIALSSSLGIGVAFSVIIIFFYQGSLSLLAGLLSLALPDPTTSPQILLVSGVGGLMIIGVGLILLEVAKVRVASFIPALVISPFIYLLFSVVF